MIVAVKSEYLIKKENVGSDSKLSNEEQVKNNEEETVPEQILKRKASSPIVDEVNVPIAEGIAVTGKAPTNKHQSTGGSSKRCRGNFPSKEERLCSFISRGLQCSFEEKCQYSHDPIAYLSSKPADLGSICYQFETFGLCSNGLMCRYGDSHIDRETGTNLRRSEEKGGVIERQQINILKKDIQYILRKKQYDQNLTNQKKIKSEQASESSAPPIESFNFTPYDGDRVKLVDFSNKVYVAPLTTVGNLPFRRIMKDFGADITCGEMAMASNLQDGQASEWALLRRHPSEDVFGVQIAGNASDLIGRVSRILDNETSTDFVDLNCGCPIDVVCDRGSGSALLRKHNKLLDIVSTMGQNLRSRSITVKLRTGWDDKVPTTHKLIPLLQKANKGNLAAIFIHGRSRTQRYAKLANWEYVLQAARSQATKRIICQSPLPEQKPRCMLLLQDPALPRIPVIGNGDILSYEDWQAHRGLLETELKDSDPEAFGLCSCAMIARGALIKPWLPVEIKESRHWDIAATERLDMLKKFCNYGLEHWGSDQQGVNTTRRFLLEWLSFLHRYTPVGLLESVQTMNQRPPTYFGRCDLETLLGSSNSVDWIRISELLLGPTPDGFLFVAKHKSNSYSTGGTGDSEAVSNG